jgi:hypothetical protein
MFSRSTQSFQTFSMGRPAPYRHSDAYLYAFYFGSVGENGAEEPISGYMFETCYDRNQNLHGEWLERVGVLGTWLAGSF